MSNNAAGSGNAFDPTENPAETDEKTDGGRTSLDVPVTDVRESQYAPPAGSVSGDGWAQRGSIEDINDRAFRTTSGYTPKGGA